MTEKFFYTSSEWNSAVENNLLEFGDKVRVVSGGLHIQRMLPYGHIMWNEKQRSWTPLEVGDTIETDEDGRGFHLT